MTGIVIFTASRDDAYQDYLRSVKEGLQVDEIREYLTDEQIQTLTESDDETIRLWGTTVATQWGKIERGDIVLVYRNGEFIARARTILTDENLPLAKHLWKREGNPWNEENPWEFLVFVDRFEEIDVPIQRFNSLIGYEPNYIPQGFMRVADRRITQLLEDYDSVENAVADLTGTGERVHEIEPDDDDDDVTEDSFEQLKRNLIAAGEDGDRSKEFERLVADAFTRLGCTARWIEGGGDTDVEITSPVHTVVEAKSRGRSDGVRNINAGGIVSHQNQRGAEHAIVVGRYFPPRAIEDAERNGITTITTDHLNDLLEIRRAYGVPPERIFDLLQDSGAFQEDRLDVLQDYIDKRVQAMESILSILKGIERSSEAVTAGQLRFILLGMSNSNNVPDEEMISHSLQFLSHPSLGLLDEEEEGYTLSTSYDNAIEVFSSIETLLQDATNRSDSRQD